MQAWKAIACAAFVSSGVVAQPVPPPRGPANPLPVPSDFLQASNETRAAVKVEYFPGNAPPRDGVRPQLSFCVKPKETAHWPLDPRDAIGMLRMQVLRSAECGGPGSEQVACRSEMQRTPRLQHITLRAEGSGCTMAATAGPAGARLMAGGACGPTGHWVPLTLHNKSRHGLWVTIYDAGGFTSTILAAACWMPGERRMACVDRRGMSLRGEAVNNDPERATARSCSERVHFDTNKHANGLYLDMSRRAEVEASFFCWRAQYGEGCDFEAPAF